jgi:hypothetical protein
MGQDDVKTLSDFSSKQLETMQQNDDFLTSKSYLYDKNPVFKGDLPIDKHDDIWDEFDLHSLEIPQKTTPRHVKVLIPKKLRNFAGNIPVHVRFHGGGFVSYIKLRLVDIGVNKNSVQGRPILHRGFHTTSRTFV